MAYLDRPALGRVSGILVVVAFDVSGHRRIIMGMTVEVQCPATFEKLLDAWAEVKKQGLNCQAGQWLAGADTEKHLKTLRTRIGPPIPLYNKENHVLMGIRIEFTKHPECKGKLFLLSPSRSASETVSAPGTP
jgi:biotin-(acetyl-CoA carboxylase) ligase